jgi:hypothetical protein
MGEPTGKLRWRDGMLEQEFRLPGGKLEWRRVVQTVTMPDGSVKEV